MQNACLYLVEYLSEHISRVLFLPLLAITEVSGGGRQAGKLLCMFPREAPLCISDQVIRENPASRGTEASAEVLVGPPLGAGGWSETPVNSSGTRLTLTLDGGLEGPPRPVMAPYPFPSASSVGVGRRRGSAWVRQFSPP